MGTPRDYYADLELPPTADINEIKKQYRKLALAYHPDRNPGREEEVNQKFQIIQSAHEILSDPDQKAKYDSSRRPTARYPHSSGVRGNPWANAAANFPPPPRRNAAGGSGRAQPPPHPPPPSGAQRWQSRFSQGPPPTAKQQYSADAEARKSAANAFEKMRRGPAQNSSRPAPQRQTNPVPPPTPARESARQRQEASFGNRKPGYNTRSNYDEPPVSNKNYASARPSEIPPEPDSSRMPDPLRQFREDPNASSFMDSRQSSPYMSHGGEKTDPFDGVPLNRAKSVREPSHHQTEGDLSSDPKHRSSSVPRNTSQAKPGANLHVPPEEHAQRPKTADETSSPPTRKSHPENAQLDGDGDAPLSPADDTSMYAKPSISCLQPGFPFHQQRPRKRVGFQYRNKSCGSAPSNLAASYAAISPSGEPPQLSFEGQQSALLETLISNLGLLRNRSAALGASVKSQGALPVGHTVTQQIPSPFANITPRFSFHVDKQSSAPNVSSSHDNRSNSADNINTQFVNDETPANWHFQAGGEDRANFEQAQSRSHSRGRPGRLSPVKQPAASSGDRATRDEYGSHDEGFDANGWSDKFGPQTFAPKANAASASPTKPSRANIRKPSKIKSTAGTAAVMEENSSEEDTYEWRGRQGHGHPAQVGSPQAMDIDSAPAGPPPPQQPRRVPVEPDRPEWRSGDVHQRPVERRVPVNPNSIGSEDTEEFRTNLQDLKNVPPLSNQKNTGLRSMDDLKDNLPFKSQAAAEVTMEHIKPRIQPLAFPDVPKAPTLSSQFAGESPTPSPASWTAYAQEFETYLHQWEKFNTLVVDHFTTRKLHVARSRDSEGYDFISAREMNSIGKYYATVQQDIGVRQRWQEACLEHGERVMEFMEFKRRMLSS